MAEPQRHNGRASILAGAYGHFNGDGRDSYDPYADPGPSSRVGAPPPSAFFPFREQIPLASNGLGMAEIGSAVPFAYGHHHHQNSGASNEPLLTNWRRSTSMSLSGSVPPSPVSPGFGPGPSANMALLANPPPLPVYPSTVTNKRANGHVRPTNSSVWNGGPMAGPTSFKETQTAPGFGATSRSPPVYTTTTTTTPSSSGGQPNGNGLGSSRSALLVGEQSSSSSSASNEVEVDALDEDGDVASSIGYDDYSRPVLEVSYFSPPQKCEIVVDWVPFLSGTQSGWYKCGVPWITIFIFLFFIFYFPISVLLPIYVLTSFFFPTSIFFACFERCCINLVFFNYL